MPSATLDTDNKYQKLMETYQQLKSERNSNIKADCKLFDNILESLLWLTECKDNQLNKYHHTNHTTNNIESNGAKDRKINVLITGSLYLVGLSLKVLNFKID